MDLNAIFRMNTESPTRFSIEWSKLGCVQQDVKFDSNSIRVKYRLASDPNDGKIYDFTGSSIVRNVILACFSFVSHKQHKEVGRWQKTHRFDYSHTVFWT